MVKELWMRLRWKTLWAIGAGIASIVGTVLAGVWAIGLDRASIGSELRNHGERIERLEECGGEYDARIRAMEVAIPRIDSNVQWLREDAERRR